MKYPTLSEISATRDMTDTFLGYNHNPRITLGEFYDMKNLTSDNYPILSPRVKRGSFTYPTGVTANTQGIISKESLCYVNDGKFYVNGYEVTGFTLTTGEKTLISMGAYVVIFPDKKYVNTLDTTDKGSLENTVTTSSTVTFTLTNIEGSAYTPHVSATEPDHDTYPLWLDTSTSPHTLKEWSTSTSMWVQVITTYIKISCSGIGAGFEEGDGVKISGITVSALSDLNNTMIIQKCDDNYIVVIGIIDATATQETAVTVARRVPTMDFVIESSNRLWGCRYGTNNDGEVVNEIYASKLADFKNWYCFQGISSDSWMASRGSDGPFTGAISYDGKPLFFKENIAHKVYGDYPSAYGITDIALRGVQKDSGKSLAIVGETLFYKSINGVCGYEGSLPAEMNDIFGDIKYTNAIGGACGNKYYISMKDSSNTYHLFVYDKDKGLWMKEDNLQVKQFCDHDGKMYYIDNNSVIRLMKTEGTTFETGKIKWNAETGIIGLSSPDHLYVSRIGLSIKAAKDAKLTLWIEYDSESQWEELFTYYSTTLRTITLVARPRRCDHFRLKFEGEGDIKIFSLTKSTTEGSDER